MGKKKKSAAGGGPANQPQDNQTIAIDLLPKLKEELEKAKSNKDHDAALKLRKQVWVTTDFSHGVEPDLPEKELRDIIKDLPFTMPGQTAEPQVNHSAQPSANSSMNRLKKLQKRLEQIASIKEKQAKGEHLEKNQIEKLATEESIRQQIEEIQEIMASCS